MGLLYLIFKKDDDELNEKYVPYVVEPSLGADRVTLAFLCEAYDEEVDEKGEVRTVLRLHPTLAPAECRQCPNGMLPLHASRSRAKSNYRCVHIYDIGPTSIA